MADHTTTPTIDLGHLKALCKLADEISISTELIGINGRGHEIALNVLGVIADSGWQLTPPVLDPPSIWTTESREAGQ